MKKMLVIKKEKKGAIKIKKKRSKSTLEKQQN
jgi:hypothetical protein